MDQSDEVQKVKSLIVAQGALFQDMRDRLDADVTRLAKDFADAQLAAQRPNGRDTGGAPSTQVSEPTWFDTKTKKPIRVLAPSDKLSAVERASGPTPSIGRFLRGLVVAGADDAQELAEERKGLQIAEDPAGGYTVAGPLASQWVDLLRAQMVLSRAGARTIPMDSKTLTIARLTADASTSWHGESAAITPSDPTFGSLTLNAKTIVCVVKMSLELSQDSVNIEDILGKSLVSAMAGAIDSAGLNGVTANAAAAPAGIFSLSGRNTVTSIGAPTSWDYVVDGMYELMLDNVAQEDIGAFVAHPAVFKKMRKLKTGIASDLTSLVPPPEVAALPKLWTTAAPLTGGTTAKAMIADWRDLLFGVRQQIQVKVLSERFLADTLEVAVVAYARCDFAAARHESFCSLEGITV